MSFACKFMKANNISLYCEVIIWQAMSCCFQHCGISDKQISHIIANSMRMMVWLSHDGCDNQWTDNQCTTHTGQMHDTPYCGHGYVSLRCGRNIAVTVEITTTT